MVFLNDMSNIQKFCKIKQFIWEGVFVSPAYLLPTL